MKVQDHLGRTPLHYAAFFEKSDEYNNELFDSNEALEIVDQNGISARGLVDKINEQRRKETLTQYEAFQSFASTIPHFYLNKTENDLE